MLAKRIIACLDIKDGRTVKGINFENIRDAGDPVELAEIYVKESVDELVFLDITATIEKRKLLVDLVHRVAERLTIPFTVGGGISSCESVSEILKAGADKVSINSAAFRSPDLINELSGKFGSQCIVLAIDTKFKDGRWSVFLDGGRTETDIDAKAWAIEAEKRGAGEILLTSMNNDGTKEGFALDITKEISQAVSIPVIASGGAGKLEHFLSVFKDAEADAALAASIFHFREISIHDLKSYLKSNAICVRG